MEQNPSSADERFRVNNPVDVMGYLREAARSRILCNVRAAGHGESYLSRLFAIDDNTDALVFDTPRAPVIARLLTPGATVSIELTLHHVRIHFDASIRQIGAYQGEPSLFVAIPDAIVRLQRRENYRISVPARRSVRLTLNPEHPGLRNLKLADLSCGGASITLSGTLDEYPTGKVFEHAQLSLDEDTEFIVDARVRHASALRMSGLVGELRIGLQFTNTPPGFEPAVARLVNEIALDLSRLRKS